MRISDRVIITSKRDFSYLRYSLADIMIDKNYIPIT